MGGGDARRLQDSARERVYRAAFGGVGIPRTVKKGLLRIARLAALVYLGLMLFLAACQNKLLYVPSRGTQAALVQEATNEGLQPWKDPSGGDHWMAHSETRGAAADRSLPRKCGLRVAPHVLRGSAKPAGLGRVPLRIPGYGAGTERRDDPHFLPPDEPPWINC
jgi:hypothetical protein